MKYLYKGLGYTAKGFEAVFLFLGALSDMTADKCQDLNHWCKQKTEEHD